MLIYDNPTYSYSAITDIEKIIKFKHKKEINLFYPYDLLIWQGVGIVQVINEKVKKIKANLIIEVRNDLGYALSLIDKKIEYISIGNNVDPATLNKIKSIALKKKVKILETEKFKIKKINL